MKNKAYENFLDIILKVPTVEKCDLINKLDKEITVDIELQDGFFHSLPLFIYLKMDIRNRSVNCQLT